MYNDNNNDCCFSCDGYVVVGVTLTWGIVMMQLCCCVWWAMACCYVISWSILDIKILHATFDHDNRRVYSTFVTTLHNTWYTSQHTDYTIHMIISHQKYTEITYINNNLKMSNDYKHWHPIQPERILYILTPCLFSTLTYGDDFVDCSILLDLWSLELEVIENKNDIYTSMICNSIPGWLGNNNMCSYRMLVYGTYHMVTPTSLTKSSKFSFA